MKIPLLQEIKDIHILSKMIKELCIKKPGRKKKKPTTIQIVSQLAELMTGKSRLTKYANPIDPIVTTYIKNIPISNTLVD